MWKNTGLDTCEWGLYYAVCGKHVHECVGEYTCVDMYGGQRLTWYFPPQLFSLFFETRFLTEPDTVWLEWLAVNPGSLPVCAPTMCG